MLFEINKKVSKIDAIVIWKLSRISRNITDLVNIVDNLSENGVALISFKDNINTLDKMGKYFIYIGGIFAEMERDSIVTQLKGGMAQRAKEGKWNGGPAPIGYDYNYETQMLEVNDKEAMTVKKIFELYTDKNYGYVKITKYLNGKHSLYPTKSGGVWNISTVKGVLDNPIYVGKIRWGYHKDWNKQRRQAKSDEFILVEGLHEAIISEDMWERTRTIRKKAITPEKRVHLTYLLTGLLKCPECGSSMVSHRVKKRNQEGYYRYYSCSKWQNSRTCKPNLLNAEKVETQVIEMINNFIIQDNVVNELKKSISLSNNDILYLEKQLKTINKYLAESEKAQQKYYQYLVDEDKLKILEEHRLLNMIDKERKNIDSLNIERQQIINQIELQNNLELGAEQITVILQNFKLLFDKATSEEQIQLLQVFIKEIRVNNSKDINERTVKEIVLNLSGLSLYLQEDTKSFEVYYGEMNRIISSGQAKGYRIIFKGLS